MSFEQEPIDNIIYFVEQQNGIDVLYASGRKGKVPIAERVFQNGDRYIIFHNVWVNPEDPGNRVTVRIRLNDFDHSAVVIRDELTNTDNPTCLFQLRLSAQSRGGYSLSAFINEDGQLGQIDFEQAWKMFEQPDGNGLPELPYINAVTA